MTEYENIISIYHILFLDYGWTREIIDNEDMNFIFDLLNVRIKTAENNSETQQEFAFIDEVL